MYLIDTLFTDNPTIVASAISSVPMGDGNTTFNLINLSEPINESPTDNETTQLYMKLILIFLIVVLVTESYYMHHSILNRAECHEIREIIILRCRATTIDRFQYIANI